MCHSTKVLWSNIFLFSMQLHWGVMWKNWDSNHPSSNPYYPSVNANLISITFASLHPLSLECSFKLSNYYRCKRKMPFFLVATRTRFLWWVRGDGQKDEMKQGRDLIRVWKAGASNRRMWRSEIKHNNIWVRSHVLWEPQTKLCKFNLLSCATCTGTVAAMSWGRWWRENRHAGGSGGQHRLKLKEL